MNIAVLGAGAWGTAISVHLAARHKVTLWARNAAQAAAMHTDRHNSRYLAGVALPANVAVSADLGAATHGATLVLIAVTTAGLRETLRRLTTEGCKAPLLCLCKGFERENAL